MRPGAAVSWVWVVLLVVTLRPARAELAVPSDTAACVGDCDTDNVVTIDEIVRAVGIALGELPGSACAAVADGSEITIDRLILSVGNALHGCPPLRIACGDGVTDLGEDCDDGNTAGGDGCAANCTFETRRVGAFALTSRITMQTTSVRTLLDGLLGSQTFTTGAARNELVVDPHGATLTQPGEIPVVVKAADVNAEPLPVDGLVCACLRGVASAPSGPGNAARGSIACGDEPLAPVGYRIVQDHDTNPGDPHNFGGLADDPECDDSFALPDGSLVRACREGVDPVCSDADAHPHQGICNGPRQFEWGQEPAPRGAAVIHYHLVLALLADGGQCSTAGPGPNEECAFPDYGPDCLPCTDDDQAPPFDLELTLTTGQADGAVFDANLDSGPTGRGAVIAADARCFGVPCETTAQGQPFDCAALIANPTGGVAGSALAGALPILDSRSIGDSVVTFTMVSE